METLEQKTNQLKEALYELEELKTKRAEENKANRTQLEALHSELSHTKKANANLQHHLERFEKDRQGLAKELYYNSVFMAVMSIELLRVPCVIVL